MTRSAGDTVRELVDRVTQLRNGDSSQIDHLASLYAVDAHVTHPFHPEHANLVTHGRESLRAHFAALPHAGASVSSRVEDWTLHTTADPEVVIAEFAYKGRVDERPLNTRFSHSSNGEPSMGDLPLRLQPPLMSKLGAS